MMFQKNTLLQILAIFPANMAYLSIGLGCGWVSPILNRFQNSDSDFSLSTDDCSLIACLHFAGRAVGCVVAAMLINRVGRNKIFIYNAIAGCIVWSAVYCTRSMPAHYAIRLLFGTGVGAAEFAAALYIGENSSPAMRGIFNGFSSLYFYVGELIAYTVGAYASYATIATVNVGLSVAVAASTLLLREPAQYLLEVARRAKDSAAAEKRFFELRGNSDAAKKEFEETKQQLAADGKVKFSLALLADRSVRAVIVVNCAVYVTGYPVINSMSSLILSTDHSLTPNEQTILMAFVQLLSLLVSPAIIERFGRRTLIMTSAAASVVSHLAMAAMFVGEKRGFAMPHQAWLLFGFMTAYSVVVAAVMFPIASTIRGELLSPQLKPLGGCVAIVLESLIAVLASGVYLSITEAYGTEINFVFFAATSAAELLYAYYDLPETRGLTLTEIQTLFKK